MASNQKERGHLIRQKRDYHVTLLLAMTFYSICLYVLKNGFSVIEKISRLKNIELD